MLTARAADADKLRGLQSGADDYLTKPFNPEELTARVAVVLRRAEGGAPGGQTLLRYPNLTIDLNRRSVTASGVDVRLSRTEWALLEQLAGNAGRVMLHGELLSRVWGPEFRDEVRYLRMWVSRLRAKLEPETEADSLISTFPGIGYRFAAPPSEAPSPRSSSRLRPARPRRGRNRPDPPRETA
jgi:two-component system KDP operon response regulator KdpE